MATVNTTTSIETFKKNNVSTLVVGNGNRTVTVCHPPNPPPPNVEMSPYIDARSASLLQVIITTATRWRLSLKRNYRSYLATELTTYRVVFLWRTGCVIAVLCLLYLFFNLFYKTRHTPGEHGCPRQISWYL